MANLRRIASRIAILMSPSPDTHYSQVNTMGEAITLDDFKKQLQKRIDNAIDDWGGSRGVKVKDMGALDQDNGYIEFEGGGVSKPWKIKFPLKMDPFDFFYDPNTDEAIEETMPHPDLVDEFERDLTPDGYCTYRKF